MRDATDVLRRCELSGSVFLNDFRRVDYTLYFVEVFRTAFAGALCIP